jgi:erythromycin esterase-like protein
MTPLRRTLQRRVLSYLDVRAGRGRRDGDVPRVVLERAARPAAKVPSRKMQSQYFYASLPRQFDDYIWFDETRAVRALEDSPRRLGGEVPDTYPFGL